MSGNGRTVPLSKVDEMACIGRYGKAPRTLAVPLLPPDTAEADWLEARHAGVGASEMAVLLGVSPHSSLFALWWQKFNRWRVESNQSMRIGTLLEGVIAELFREAHPGAQLYRPGAALWAHPDHPFMLCTPDYLAVFPEDPTRVVPVECKSDEGGGGWGRSGTPTVPEHHRVQAVCQAQIFGSRLAYVARRAGKRFTWHPIEVELDSDEYMGWVSQASRFLTSIDAGVSPDVDGSPSTEDTLTRLYSDAPDADAEPVVISVELARGYDEARAELAAAQERFRYRQNLIRYALADRALVAVDLEGRRVATRRVYKRDGYTVGPSMVDGIWPAPGKATES